MSDSLTDNLGKQMVYLEIATADASQRCRNASEVSSSSADSQCRLARPSSAYSMDNTLTDSKVHKSLPSDIIFSLKFRRSIWVPMSNGTAGEETPTYEQKAETDSVCEGRAGMYPGRALVKQD